MTEITISKTRTERVVPKYDLEERTYKFALSVAILSKKFPKNTSNIEYVRQLIRASSSIGANYIEANEALSKKDFLMRIKICRKEAKESAYWLSLLVDTNSEDLRGEVMVLRGEAIEFKKIFSSILK